MGWVKVASYPDATLAHLALQALAADGIRGRLADEHTATIDPLLGGAIGGVKLLVLEAEAERARSLLEAPEAEGDDADADELCCPACDSPYVRRGHGASARRWALLGLGLPLLFREPRWVCARCESDFDEPAPRARADYRRAPARAGEPVFALARGHAASGAGAGLAAGALGFWMGVPELFWALPLAGALLGNGLTRTVCSKPGCGAALGPKDERCGACGGLVVGSVSTRREHWIRRAAWKRGAELVDR